MYVSAAAGPLATSAQLCGSMRGHARAAAHASRIVEACRYVSADSGTAVHTAAPLATHELPLAPCAHFMYKKRARIDYSRHPVLSAALSSNALGDEQRRSLALLTMLVSTDVEHRIIPPALLITAPFIKFLLHNHSINIK